MIWLTGVESLGNKSGALNFHPSGLQWTTFLIAAGSETSKNQFEDRCPFTGSVKPTLKPSLSLQRKNLWKKQWSGERRGGSCQLLKLSRSPDQHMANCGKEKRAVQQHQHHSRKIHMTKIIVTRKKLNRHSLIIIGKNTICLFCLWMRYTDWKVEILDDETLPNDRARVRMFDCSNLLPAGDSVCKYGHDRDTTHASM